MNIKGKITISRITSTDPRGSRVRISLEDENSRIGFVELDIGFKQFGMALAGLSSQPCDIFLRGLELLGKKHENKTEFIRLPRKSNVEYEVRWRDKPFGARTRNLELAVEVYNSI